MEVYGFMIFGGLFMSIILILVGIIIGGCIDRSDRKKSGTERTDKNISERTRDGFVYSDVHNSRTNYLRNSVMGNVHREVDSGSDMGYAPSTEDIIIVLDSLPYTAHLSSHETDCVRRASNIIELLKRFVDDSE